MTTAAIGGIPSKNEWMPHKFHKNQLFKIEDNYLEKHPMPG